MMQWKFDATHSQIKKFKIAAQNGKCNVARSRIGWLAIVLSIAVVSLATNVRGEDFTQLSLDELMNIQVYSVSKKDESANQAAAAVFVLTSTDIERSGAGSIPELLKLVPGLDVSRIDASAWSIGSRGFGGRFANKLLVLIDGRTVYEAGFSGVYWETLDLILEDIERIEVIKGPGGTMWGANAVNGIINIITKDSKKTTGSLVSAGAGNEQRGEGDFRVGGELTNNTSGRVWGKMRKLDSTGNQDSPGESHDGLESFHVGYRLDSKLSNNTRLELSGEGYRGFGNLNMDIISFASPYTYILDDTAKFSGGNQVLKLESKPDDRNTLSAKVYASNSEMDEYFSRSSQNTYDLDLQHDVSVNDRLNLSWGGNYRVIDHSLRGSDVVTYSDANVVLQPYSGFFQGSYRLIDSLELILGTKLEHNDFTGWANQPSVRLVWNPWEDHTFWVGYSDAVRTPSSVTHNMKDSQWLIWDRGPEQVPVLASTIGTPDISSENLGAYEFGYRISKDKKWSLDLETFYFDYSNLYALNFIDTKPDTSHAIPVIEWQYQFQNLASAKSYGGELIGTYYLSNATLFQAGYSYIDTKAETDTPGVDPYVALERRFTPQHQLSLRSLVNLGHGIEADSFIKFVDQVKIFGFVDQVMTDKLDINSYTELDAKLSWSATENLKFEIIGTGLLRPSQIEFKNYDSFAPTATRIQRGIFGKATWRF